MVEYSQIVIFLVILIAVPLQFLLSPASISETRYHFHRFKSTLSRVIQLFLRREKELEETVELTEKEKKAKYFGASPRVRDPRPPNVKFYVGDVIRHKVHGYRAVIIGWDEKAMAPKEWIRRTHKGNKNWSEEPNYSVVIDTRDRLIPQLAYVVQENIERDQGRIFHPLVRSYFESFDGKHYKSRPWHLKVYPYG